MSRIRPRKSGTSGRPCARRIDAAGYPNRTPLVLARERGLFDAMAPDLLAGDGEATVDREPRPGRPAEPVVTMEDLERGFASTDVSRVHAAAFVAGRCQPEQPADAERLGTRLRALLDGADTDDLGSRALAYVDAAMSLVLRGDGDRGRAALAGVVRAARGTMADHLAAFYLAELGDPSGYPLMVQELRSPTGYTRLIAARHLAGFLPYDGEQVGDETVDVRARLVERFDDEDELVAIEIPGLLAELGGDELEATLVRLAATARHPDAARAAQHVLDHLRGEA